MAILREINPNQAGGRGRSGLWTVLRRTDRSKLFSLTFDRGLNLRENGTWNLSHTRFQYWSNFQENFINARVIFFVWTSPILVVGEVPFFRITYPYRQILENSSSVKNVKSTARDGSLSWLWCHTGHFLVSKMKFYFRKYLTKFSKIAGAHGGTILEDSFGIRRGARIFTHNIQWVNLGEIQWF